MKKIVSFMVVLGFALTAQADLVDDFQGYAVGAVEETASPPWTAEAEGLSSISADTGNQYITFGGDGDWRHYYRNTGVEVSSLSTLFFRLYVEEESGVDHCFGMTDEEAPTWYTAYASYVRVTDDTDAVAGVVSLDLRSDDIFVEDIAALNLNQWYNVWLVIDPTTDSGVFSVYCTEDGVSASGTEAVYSGAGFRKAYANPLITFLLFAGQNAGQVVRVDDVYVLSGEYLEIPITGLPYSPAVEQGEPVGTEIPTTLRWKAASDPEGVYEVNPAIVDQYVFLSGGKSTDPNLYYHGATAVDESIWSLTDPNSEYSFTGQLDRTYYWAVVEVIEGYEQAFTPGLSVLEDVDPNNITGPVWSYNSTRSQPTITRQPADVRVFTTDPTAAFTVEFTSLVNPVTATWYKDDVELIPGGDVSVETDPYAYSTLTIATPTLEDEGKYYCILSVQEGQEDDVQTATRLLVIKQLLSEYTFDNPADRLADTGERAAEIGVIRDPAQGKSVAGLAEPNEMLAYPVTLTYVPGIEGDAVYLDGTQYIDLDPNGYPKAGPLNTFGDIRGGGYEKAGFGRGMDEGSILCWVKLESDGAVTMNANIADGTHYGVTTDGAANARIIVRGENWDGGWQNLGEANGTYLMDAFDLQDGQWHMFAATWDNSTARIYINGELVATNTQGYTERYYPWDLSNLIGASRSGQPNRHILNTNDFLIGAVDEFRVYNYVISADEIATEYMTKNALGVIPCADHNFAGSAYNFDNTISSYCTVDLADFAIFVENWLTDGLYEGL